MKDTGLRNLPLHGFDANRIWLAVVALAADLTAWMQTLALHDHPARRWEPKRLRLRMFSLAGVLARTGRAVTVHLSARSPCNDARRPSPHPAPRDHRRNRHHLTPRPGPPQRPPITSAVEADDRRTDTGGFPTPCPTPQQNHPEPAPEPAEQPSHGKITQDRG